MSSSWARPGVKVVCVDAEAGFGCWSGDAPVVGRTYTIHATWVDDADGELILDLALKRSKLAADFWGQPVGYGVERFRPLITRSQDDDVAMIKSLLVGDKVPA